MPIERHGGTGSGIRRGANGSRAVLRPQGRGADGSNVLPTDTAMANEVNSGGLFDAALSASYVAQEVTASGKLFTFKFDGVPNPGDGCVGIRIGKDSTDTHALAVTYEIDGDPRFASALDFENHEFVLLGVCTENPDNPDGEIDRIRYDPVTYRLLISPSAGYASAARSNVHVHGTDFFPIRMERAAGRTHDSGGVAVDAYGDMPVLFATQYETVAAIGAGGHRRLYLDLGGDDPNRGFSFGVDSAKDDTNDFWLFDKVAQNLRFVVKANGDFDTNGNTVKAGKLWASGNGVATNATAVHVQNTAAGGGRYYGMSSGIPGVAEAGFCIYDWTAAAGVGVPRVVINANGTVVIGNGVALGTTATDGFLSLPSMAGTPTGVPTAYGVAVPMVVDTTGSKLWARIGGAWKSVTLT